MAESVPELTPGSVVRDRDGDHDDELRVVAVYPDQRAGDWYIDDIDATVADVNPEYPPDDAVVACVYLEDVEKELGPGAPADLVRRRAARGDLRTYTFPRSRLDDGGEEA